MMRKMIGKLRERFSAIVRTVVAGIMRLFGRELSDKELDGIMQFLKFCMVGLSNTAISMGVYYIFVLIDRGLYQAGNAVGFVASVLNSYYWNSRFVFDKRDEQAKTIAKSFAAYGSNLLIAAGLLHLFVEILGFSPFIAPFCNLVITIPLNFLLNKFWVMRKK